MFWNNAISDLPVSLHPLSTPLTSHRGHPAPTKLSNHPRATLLLMTHSLTESSKQVATLFSLDPCGFGTAAGKTGALGLGIASHHNDSTCMKTIAQGQGLLLSVLQEQLG
jgi:hypothetical protein